MNKVSPQRKLEIERRVKQILALSASGFEVIDLNESRQFRINGRIDLYPKNEKWHDIQENKRGYFDADRLADFLPKFLIQDISSAPKVRATGIFHFCFRCTKSKPVSEFPTGASSWCSACVESFQTN